MHDEYIIPLNGLEKGRKDFRWHVGKEFFTGFDNSEIRDANVWVEVVVAKVSGRTEVDCNIDGSVVTVCDRCLGDLELGIETEVALTVKFGESPDSPEADEENGREVVWVEEDIDSMDMSQIIYDYICLSVPLHKVHEIGDCDPEVLKYIKSEEKMDEEPVQESPFAVLKSLLDNKSDN